MLNKLRGRIVEKYGTISAFASAVGVSRVSIGQIISERTRPRVNTALRLADALEIPQEELFLFFGPTLEKAQDSRKEA